MLAEMQDYPSTLLSLLCYQLFTGYFNRFLKFFLIFPNRFSKVSICRKLIKKIKFKIFHLFSSANSLDSFKRIEQEIASGANDGEFNKDFYDRFFDKSFVFSLRHFFIFFLSF